MQTLVEQGRHPPEFDRFFPPQLRDLHHEERALDAFERQWFSIVVHDGHNALANQVGPKPISGGRFDVEPIIGYAGLITTTQDGAFLGPALAAYSAACRNLGIVAELIRFNPFLDNHLAFEGRPELRVLPVKQLVAVDCTGGPDDLVGRFSSACRRRLRIGHETLRAELMPASEGLGLFRALYERSMRRVGADAQWFYDEAAYERLARPGDYQVAGVWRGDELVSTALVGLHETAWHYVLAANADEPAPGGGERLVHTIACAAQDDGAKRLLLGGGVGAAPDDALLRYKSRFAQDRLTFRIGQMVHDPAAFEALQAEAIRRKPEIAERAFFLKHRL